MEKIVINWPEDGGGYSFTADLTAAGIDGQVIRIAFKNARFERGQRDRDRWTVSDLRLAAETFRTLDRQGYQFRHTGESDLFEDHAERLARRVEHDMKHHGKRLAPIYDRENPATVHDILWSWSEGHMSGVEACRLMGCTVEELHEAAHDNDVPEPDRGQAPTFGGPKP